MPEPVRKLENEPNTKIDIIFCIYTRHGKEADQSSVLAPKERPFGYKYLLKLTGETIGEEGGYYEMPAFIPRWRKTSGSRWGNSPAMVALADILQLNETRMLKTRGVEKGIDPPWLANERAGLTDLGMDAGSVSILKDINGVREHQSVARMDWAYEEIADLRASIRGYFMVDQLELKESPAMTATEVQVRYELMQRLLGPTVGRLQSDFLEPMIQRTFNLLLRAGQLPAIPNSVYGESGTPSRVDVEYSSPLTRAQKADSVASIERLVMGVSAVAAIKPDVIDAFDWDESVWDMAKKLGISPKLNNEPQQVKILRDQRAADMAAMQQAEVDKANAQTNKMNSEAQSNANTQ